jgi:hypothetical protein
VRVTAQEAHPASVVGLAESMLVDITVGVSVGGGAVGAIIVGGVVGVGVAAGLQIQATVWGVAPPVTEKVKVPLLHAIPEIVTDCEEPGVSVPFAGLKLAPTSLLADQAIFPLEAVSSVNVTVHPVARQVLSRLFGVTPHVGGDGGVVGVNGGVEVGAFVGDRVGGADVGRVVGGIVVGIVLTTREIFICSFPPLDRIFSAAE